MNPAKRRQKLQASQAAFQAGDTATAEQLCQAILRTNKADVQAWHALAVMASSRGDDSAALSHLTRCLTLSPRHAPFHQDLARVHALAGRYAQSLASLGQAASLQPANVQVLTDMADVLERNGQHEQGHALLQPHWQALQAGEGDEDMALVMMRLLDRAGRCDQAIDLGQRRLTLPARHLPTRRFLLQLLGRLHEKAGDAAAAFNAFAQAKLLERDDFDAAAYRRDIDQLINAYSSTAMARLPRARTGSALPVFIACMPRSGSTLVEQIIHSHPQAHGSGESTDLHQAVLGLAAMPGLALPYPHSIGAVDQSALDTLAAKLVQSMAVLAPTALRVTNKHLLNYLHLGLVALLFPGARVIHLKRDPMDNGLACFMASLPPALMPWSANLQHIGLALREHDRLMAHWRQTLDLQMLELSYEDLVRDTEAQTRRIIDFCGLAWDDRCLRFWEAQRVVLTPSYDQVRRPIFTSAMGRWQRYESFLGPLREALED